MSYYCEICGDYADVHHIVHRSEGGLNYKLEMQNNLRELFIKSFYTGNDIKIMLGLTPGSLKKLTKNLKLYKEGYSSDDLIFNLMGRKVYSEEYIEDFILQKAISCI